MTKIARALAMLLVLVLALVLAPGASSAQPADSKPSAAADAVGRAHFQRGQRLSASGNYAGAYREFAAGYAATKRPLFLFNMGEAARASGDVAKARDSYLEFLRVDPKSALAATARTRLAELDRIAGTSPRPERPSSQPAPLPSSGSPTTSTPTTSTPTTGAPTTGAPTTGAPTTGAPSTSTPTTGTRSTGASPTNTSPSAVTTARGATRTDLLPLKPPSETPPRPTRPSSDDGLPPERFTTSRDTESKPLWKKWPFWAVVGVGAVAGGAIVFAVTRPDGNPCPGDCTRYDFR